MKDWKTTVVGFMSGLIVLLMQAVAILDTDPKTNLDYAQVMAGLAMMGIGWAAADSSADKNKKPPVPDVPVPDSKKYGKGSDVTITSHVSAGRESHHQGSG